MRSLAVLAILALTRPAGADRAISLAEAIALARAHRSEAAQAEIDLKRAKLQVLKAALERAHLTISTSLTEQAQRLNLNGPLDCRTIGSPTCAAEAHPFQAQATLTVPLWSGFTVEADLARAKSLERSATAEKAAALNSIAREAADAYWEVRRAELALGVARAAFDRAKVIEKAARARLDAGIAPQVDFERAHVSSARQASLVSTLAAQAQVARAQLGLALQVDEPLAPSEDPAAHTPALPPVARLVSEAMRGRPELRQADATLEAQVQSVRAAKGAYWPQLSLVGQATAANYQDFTKPGAPETVGFTVLGGLQLNWILFDTLSTWTSVRDAGFVRDLAVEDARKARYSVRAEVLSAHGRLAGALERRTIAVDSVASARRALEQLEKRYQVGNALVLEVLLAQEDLTQLEGELSDAQVSAAEAEADLLAALGRL